MSLIEFIQDEVRQLRRDVEALQAGGSAVAPSAKLTERVDRLEALVGPTHKAATVQDIEKYGRQLEKLEKHVYSQTLGDRVTELETRVAQIEAATEKQPEAAPTPVKKAAASRRRT